MNTVVQPEDFPDDMQDENGKYHNRCATCEKFFVGYKRRIVCRIHTEKFGNVSIENHKEEKL